MCLLKPTGIATRIYFYDKNKTFISSPDVIYTNQLISSFTSPNNAYYMLFRLAIGYGATYNNDICVSYGSTTTYTPYTSQEADIDLGDIEYCKIGNYEDRIFRNVEGDPDYDSQRTGTWYIKKNIEKYTIPNNAGGYNSGSNWFYIGTSNFTNINSTANTPLLSTHFENINLQLSGNENVNGIWNIGTHIVIRNTALSSASDYQTFFTNNNVIMYSPLATPTFTPITGTLAEQLEYVYKNMLSQTGQTNISQVNNDLPFVINATTLKDLSNY